MQPKHQRVLQRLSHADQQLQSHHMLLVQAATHHTSRYCHNSSLADVSSQPHGSTSFNRNHCDNSSSRLHTALSQAIAMDVHLHVDMYVNSAQEVMPSSTMHNLDCDIAYSTDQIARIHILHLITNRQSLAWHALKPTR